MGLVVITKYHGPTNYRPGRVSANMYRKAKHTVSWDCELDVPQNHEAAVNALLAKSGQPPMPEGTPRGELPNQSGYAFVITG